MLTYVWIGLGGTLGSMARGWLSLMIGRLVGTQFPWGTLVINIAGSFVIAFFGTLTASSGRLPMSADARTFVMVGICGGFTTFSSFSLQTMDLARDGRIVQAVGNVALSVALCLLAASIGFLAAGALTPTRVVTGSAQPAPAASIIAVLDRPDTAPGLLAAADRMGALFRARQVEAMVLEWTPPLTRAPTEEILTADRETALEAGREQWGERLETILIERSRRPGAPPLAWETVSGEPERAIAAEGRAAAALVIAGRSDHAGARARHVLHAALFDAARPVLVVPPGADGDFGRCVAVAWKDDGRAAQAAEAAMPILRAADRIVVLRGATDAMPDPGLPAFFTGRGLRATLRVVPPGEGPMAARLLAAAHAEVADLIVMGGYTHGEWREAMLGGVTRHMLTHSDIPLLLRH
jgi:protein CrcB